MVEVSTELIVDDVERERVDGRVDERQTETDRLKHVPEGIVVEQVVVPADQIYVARKPADDKDSHEDEDNLGHLRSRMPCQVVHRCHRFGLIPLMDRC